jgi:hypothetical protein
MEKTLEQLKEALHNELTASVLAGDSTVLEELLNFVPTPNLFGALSDEGQKEFKYFDGVGEEIADVDYISITAIDKHSGDSTSRNFSVDSDIILKSMVEEWKKELPYRRYELVTSDFINAFDEKIIAILDELEVSN